MRTLHLARCGITDVGASHLLSALRHNEHLIKVNVEGNLLSTEAVTSIREITRKNLAANPELGTSTEQRDRARVVEQRMMQQVECENPNMSGTARFITLMQEVNDKLVECPQHLIAQKATELLRQALSNAKTRNDHPKTIKLLELTLNLRLMLLDNVARGIQTDIRVIGQMQAEIQALIEAPEDAFLAAAQPLEVPVAEVPLSINQAPSQPAQTVEQPANSTQRAASPRSCPSFDQQRHFSTRRRSITPDSVVVEAKDQKDITDKADETHQLDEAHQHDEIEAIMGETNATCVVC